MMLVMPPPRSSLVRPAIILMVAITVLLSGTRLTHFELRKATAAVVKTAEEEGPRAQTSRAAITVRAPGGGAPELEIVVATPSRVRPVFPRPVSDIRPVEHTAGYSALGTSLPRSKRWAVLGGHGRHGAG